MSSPERIPLTPRELAEAVINVSLSAKNGKGDSGDFVRIVAAIAFFRSQVMKLRNGHPSKNEKHEESIIGKKNPEMSNRSFQEALNIFLQIFDGIPWDADIEMEKTAIELWVIGKKLELTQSTTSYARRRLNYDATFQKISPLLKTYVGGRKALNLSMLLEDLMFIIHLGFEFPDAETAKNALSSISDKINQLKKFLDNPALDLAQDPNKTKFSQMVREICNALKQFCTEQEKSTERQKACVPEAAE